VAGRILIPVHVLPRGSRSGIVGVQHGRLRIKTTAPPADGRANKDVARQLAGLFGVPPSRISLKTGARSRQKTYVIEDPATIPDWVKDLDFS
jgi:hypothetical protein